jgi:hypothetical protein
MCAQMLRNTHGSNKKKTLVKKNIESKCTISLLIGPNVVVGWLTLLVRVREVPILNLGPVTYYPYLDFSWIFSVSPNIYRNRALNKAKIASIHILFASNQSFTDQPFILHWCLVIGYSYWVVYLLCVPIWVLIPWFIHQCSPVSLQTYSSKTGSWQEMALNLADVASLSHKTRFFNMQ